MEHEYSGRIYSWPVEMGVLWWQKGGSMDYEVGEIDLNLRPGELISAMIPINGKLFVFTQFRSFQVVRKSKWRLKWERLLNRIGLAQMFKVGILLLCAVLAGCRSHKNDTYYKDYETDKERGGIYVYWIENKPVSNRYGVCAEVYSQNGHFDGKYEGKWGGENHRKDAPWNEDTKSHVGFAEFKNQKDAEAWGDALCPN